jgi:nitroreductase
MNETIKTIMSRRSIRAYKEEQIKENELKAIIDAGLYAPSAMNQQSWHFTVVQKKELMNKINEVCKIIMQRTSNQDFNIFYNAPTVIIISGDDKAIAPKNDGSLAMGNLFLAAESLGIGSCWVHAVTALSGSEEGKRLIKELGIPEGYSIIGSGAFGYKAVETAAATPRKEGAVNIIK